LAGNVPQNASPLKGLVWFGLVGATFTLLCAVAKSVPREQCRGKKECLSPLLKLFLVFTSEFALVCRVTLDKIPIVMQRSAPMCMKALYNRMNSSPHHLKHDGRMQFGLFLKGIGVTLEDSIAWWRESMMKVRLRPWGAGGNGCSVWEGLRGDERGVVPASQI